MPEPSAGRRPIPDLPWESLSHRQVLAGLAAQGWVPCGVGDWAVALRSPEGTVPVDHPVVKQFAEQWQARARNTEFAEVSRAARMIDAEYRKSTPWWGGYDLDDAHIFRAADRPDPVYRAGEQCR